METFMGIMYIVLGLGGILVVIFWAIYLIKQFCGLGKEIIIENVHKKNEVKICPNGHMYKNSNKCPYCSKLKDFNPPKRELNLNDIRSDFCNNYNFKELINDYIIRNAEFSDCVIKESDWCEIYHSFNQNLPSDKGGWGYTIADAIIIDLNNILEGERLEYKIVKLRLNLELFLYQQKDIRFYDIKEKNIKQTLYSGNKIKYDTLVCEHICFHQTDYDELSKEYEQYEKNPTAYSSDFLLEHNKKRVSLMYHVKSEFFFDVTKGYV